MSVPEVVEAVAEEEELVLVVLLLLNTVQARLGSAAVVVEVEREQLVLLVVVMLLVIAIELLLAQKLVMATLVTVEVFEVNGKDLELVVAKPALLTGVCLTPEMLLLLVLSLPHGHRDCGGRCIWRYALHIAGSSGFF